MRGSTLLDILLILAHRHRLGFFKLTCPRSPRRRGGARKGPVLEFPIWPLLPSPPSREAAGLWSARGRPVFRQHIIPNQGFQAAVGGYGAPPSREAIPLPTLTRPSWEANAMTQCPFRRLPFDLYDSGDVM